MEGFKLTGPHWAAGATVTWSFADPAQPNGALFTGAIPAAYQAVIRNAVARWDDLVSLTLQEVPDNTPDVGIRIGWSNFVGIATGQIGETDATYSGALFLPGTEIRLQDPAQLPLAGTDPAYAGTATTLYQDALHELGHALGLDHSTDPLSVMYPMLSSDNRELDATDLAGIRALYAQPAFAVTDTATGASRHPDGTAYAGPVSYLDRQFGYGGPDSLAVVATVPNVFIRTGDANDAITAQSGRNVLDGGQGSNFLTGGTGSDTFFVDGRGGGPTWTTVTNFHHGSSATLWGFDPGVSASEWVADGGTTGFTGPTLHTELAGAGGVFTSLTFASLSAADTARLQVTTGASGGIPYLAVINPA